MSHVSQGGVLIQHIHEECTESFTAGNKQGFNYKFRYKFQQTSCLKFNLGLGRNRRACTVNNVEVTLAVPTYWVTT
jgi:hypothetical protein